MHYKISSIIKLTIANLIAISCNNITKPAPFNRSKWLNYYSFDGPNRVSMAEDLIKTNRLIGLSNRQMLQLLGPPAHYDDTTKTVYELSQEFDMIDPISGKDLIIKFNKDSTVIGSKIEEWHKH